MLTVLQQIIILLLFVASGYVLGKTRLVNSEHSGLLSKLLIYIFLPCNIIKTFSARFNIDFISANWYWIVLSSAITLALAFGAHFLVKLITKNKYERSVFEYSTVVPNSGYIGYPLAEGIFGQAGLIGIMTMGLPLQIYIYTFGYAILTKSSLKLKKLINPVLISILIGMVIGLSKLPIPKLASSILESASGCMAPVSMILTGLVISEFKLKEILLDKKVYIISALRLLVIPIAVGASLRPFCDDWTVSIAVLLYSLPCGMNTVVFPKFVGEDCKKGAGIALVSTLLSALTVPLMFFIFGIG